MIMSFDECLGAVTGGFIPKSESKKSQDLVVCNSKIGSGNTDTTPSCPVYQSQTNSYLKTRQIILYITACLFI